MWIKSILNNISKIKFIQVFLITFLVTLFWDISLISKYSDKKYIIYICIVTILLNLTAIMLIVVGFNRKYFNSFFRFLNQDKYIYFVYFVIALVTVSVINTWLSEDGYIYYNSLKDAKSWDFLHINKLNLAGHSCYAYTAFILLGEYITPNNVIGARIVQMIMAFVAVFCFKEIIKKILANASKIFVFLATFMFAVSPLFMGLISEINTDFPLLIFLVCLVYCDIYEYKILEGFFCLCLCFSKETGVVLFIMYYLGKIGFMLIRDKIRNPIVICKLVIKKYVPQFFTGIVFVVYYVFNRHYGWLHSMSVNNATSKKNGNMEVILNNYIKLSSFGVSKRYIQRKIVDILFLNFNWISYFLCILLVCFFVFYGKKIINNKLNVKVEVLCGIVFLFVGFMIYNLFYITYNEFRYFLPYVFMSVLGAVLAIYILIQKEKIRNLTMIVITMIFFASNFYSFDPLSNLLISHQKTGLGNIYEVIHYEHKQIDGIEYITNICSVGKENNRYARICNSMTYNLQHAYFSSAFEKTLNELDYNERDLIIVPSIYGKNTYAMSYILFGRNNIVGIDNYYWNLNSKKLEINNIENEKYFYSSDKYAKININAVSEDFNLNEIDTSLYDNIYYIALPFDEDYDFKNFEEQCIDKKTINSYGWKWDVYRLK